MRFARIGFLIALPLSLCGIGVYAALQSNPSPAPSLTAFAPEGALLAIESPDFKGLLQSWSKSQEEQRWLKSENYEGFSNSRLFSRLSEAQGQFADTAGLATNADFLTQVAGSRSMFAWYDIGKLEFLYITEMPSGQAAKTPLLALRDKFEQRMAGDTPFFVRTSGESSQGEQARTVAFAVRGNYLLLATREDLIANSLQLMQKPTERNILHDPWYAQTVAAANRAPGDLRMTLNLTKIVPSPYFRSYWVQGNITEMKQYSAGLSDLYRETSGFREERVLIAKTPRNENSTTDLAPVLAYLPPQTGAYRATAQPTTDAILSQLEDKLLTRGQTAYRDSHIAPSADLSTPETSGGDDFETRIDEPVAVQQPRSADLASLRELLEAAHPTAMLTLSASDPAKPGDNTQVFSQIHTAVALEASAPWNEQQWQQGLITSIAPHAVATNSVLTWKPHHEGASSWYELSGLQNFALAVKGKMVLIASDSATMARLIAASQQAKPAPAIATTIAGFDHASERASFRRLTAQLDMEHGNDPSSGGTPHHFFSGNMASLSDTFSDLAAERFSETTSPDQVTHQTVLYEWKR